MTHPLTIYVTPPPSLLLAQLIRLIFQLEFYSPQWFISETDLEDETAESDRQWKFGEKYWDDRDKGFQGVQFEPIW